MRGCFGHIVRLVSRAVADENAGFFDATDPDHEAAWKNSASYPAYSISLTGVGEPNPAPRLPSPAGANSGPY